MHSTQFRKNSRSPLLLVVVFGLGVSCSSAHQPGEGGAPSGSGGAGSGAGSGASGASTTLGAGGSGTASGAGGSGTASGAGGNVTASGTVDGGGGGTSPSPALCDVPQPFPTPAANSVVGSGTPASCTEETLRAAVTAGGHVTFSCGGAPATISVSKAIQVTKPTVLDGAGNITLDGGGKTQILIVASNQSLSVRNLRFVNGAAPQSTDADGIGGAVAGNWRSKVEVVGCTFENNVAGRGGGAVAVWTGSSLVVTGSTFVGNTSWYGGAIYSLLSPLTVVNSVFSNNASVTSVNGNGETVGGDAGAIGTDGASESSPDGSTSGDVLICGAHFANNKSSGSGGGAFFWVYPPDRITIDRTTVESNQAGGFAAAMRISNGAIIVKSSSFLSNASDSNGGGLYLDCAPTCTITNSTFYNNSTKAFGGAIFGDGYQVNNVTFAKNFAGGHGGALFGSKFVLNNTIFVDNTSGNPWNQAMNCSSTGTGDHVLQWLSSASNAGYDTCIANPITADPTLGVPADNGGTTLTMLPGKQSAALGAGAGCETTDQRGQTRNATKCDLGAVELP